MHEHISGAPRSRFGQALTQKPLLRFRPRVALRRVPAVEPGPFHQVGRRQGPAPLPAAPAASPGGNELRRHVEPFFGGGALFFAQQPSRALVSDVNPNLVTTYKAVRDDVDGVIERLGVLGGQALERAVLPRPRAVQPRQGHRRTRSRRHVRLPEQDVLQRFAPREQPAASSTSPRAATRTRASWTRKGCAPRASRSRAPTSAANPLMRCCAMRAPATLSTSTRRTRPCPRRRTSRPTPSAVSAPRTRSASATSTSELDRRGCKLMLSNSDVPMIREIFAELPHRRDHGGPGHQLGRLPPRSRPRSRGSELLRQFSPPIGRFLPESSFDAVAKRRSIRSPPHDGFGKTQGKVASGEVSRWCRWPRLRGAARCSAPSGTAAFKVLGFDVDPAKIKPSTAGESYLKHLGDALVSDMKRLGPVSSPRRTPKRLKEADALILCVPTPLGQAAPAGPELRHGHDAHGGGTPAARTSSWSSSRRPIRARPAATCCRCLKPRA
jgi:hypothetical protein